jgi:hypothetical protein
VISNLVAFVGLLLFWTLLVSVVLFVGLSAWCVLVELTEAAYRRRARKGQGPPLPFGQAERGYVRK